MVTTEYLERQVSVQGLNLNYQEWGPADAPAVLAVHGFGLSGHMYDEFARRVQGRYHIFALDQRGHGDSDWSEEGDYTREAFVADIEAFRREVGLEKFILIGHSMGGLNSVAYAARYPEHVEGLVLVDVGPEQASEGVDNIMRFTRGPDELAFDEFVEMAHRFNPRRSLENIRERMTYRLKPIGNGKWTWKFDRRFREDVDALRVGSDSSGDELWQVFRSVKAPTLLIRGGESDVLTPEVAERVVAEMQVARLAIVPGAGHSVPGDAPEEFTRVVTEFIEDVHEGRLAATASNGTPPLTDLVQTQERRRPGFNPLAVAFVGAAAVLAVAGVLYMLKSRRDRRSRRRMEELRRRAAARAAAMEALDAREMRRRAGLASYAVARAGRAGARRAAAAARDFDYEAARARSAHLLHAAEERGRQSSKELRKRSKRSGALKSPLSLVGAASGRGRRRKRRWWR